MKGLDRQHLGGDLLKRVSRSFYLSMRFLPGAMREPVSLGYLLARASDTLADTAAAPGALRRDCLERFRQSLPETREDFSEFFALVMRDFAPHQSHQGERELLQRLPDLFAWLSAMPEKNRRTVVAVLEEITRGQLWDLEHFAGAGPERIVATGSVGELEAYTWRVAGCVGEFWTRVGRENLGDGFAREPDLAEMLSSGRAMGEGLQLVNILRDLGEDIGQGRCYLPRPELMAAGWDGGAGAPPDEALREVAARWRVRCRERLARGWDYLDRLGGFRARFATALPLLLAEATVDRLEAGETRCLKEKIKVSRAEVRSAMGASARIALFRPRRQGGKG